MLTCVIYEMYLIARRVTTKCTKQFFLYIKLITIVPTKISYLILHKLF